MVTSSVCENDATTFEITMENHSQDIMKKAVLVTTDDTTRKQIVSQNTYLTEKYFKFFLRRGMINTR